jgi:CheY-like chemotaxis protein
MSDLILIVDDNPANLRLLAFLLDAVGYQTRTAANAEEALALLETLRPRMLLLDLQLPGMDGLTLARLLRTRPALHELIIVAVTAHAMRGDEELARAAGCDGFVTKPIDTRTLPRTIAGYLAAPARTI